MGSSHSTFAAAPSPPGLPASCPVNHAAKDAPTPASAAPSTLPAACPVNHGKDSPSSSPTGLPAACPVSHEKRGRGTVYNVYAQPIDPTNQMPVTANQKPAPGQREELSVERVQSSIPKGGTEATWLYPSPQMFYNGGVAEGCVGTVHLRASPSATIPLGCSARAQGKGERCRGAGRWHGRRYPRTCFSMIAVRYFVN